MIQNRGVFDHVTPFSKDNENKGDQEVLAVPHSIPSPTVASAGVFFLRNTNHNPCPKPRDLCVFK